MSLYFLKNGVLFIYFLKGLGIVAIIILILLLFFFSSEGGFTSAVCHSSSSSAGVLANGRSMTNYLDDDISIYDIPAYDTESSLVIL